ncbi:MAG: diphthine synthase [Candidatus Aenigmatarchaeota archaeon]
MLVLIGLGLFDEKDLSLRGIEEAKKAEKAYLELYTTAWFGDIKRLEEIVGKKIEILKRKDLEESSDKILEEAKAQDIAILVGGDPLVATTHSALLLEAKKKEIKTKVIHNSSIISAIAETGLHIYKFGPCVTIPFPEKTKGKLPESIYETIKMNKAHGLHTLCLLDIDAEENRLMSVKEALEILFNIEEMRREGVISLEEKIVVFSRAGSKDAKIFFEQIKDLMKTEVKLPAVLIIPGLLHFTEKEFLETITSSSLHD